jgi:hypothetical protein
VLQRAFAQQRVEFVQGPACRSCLADLVDEDELQRRLLRISQKVGSVDSIAPMPYTTMVRAAARTRDTGARWR